MQLEVGMVLEGKVTGITKFGAFIELPGGKTGMVHISEVADTYVKSITDFIQEGDTVKVKVINIGDNGKIGLSIRQAVVKPQPEPAARPDISFEDRLSKFMKDSNEKLVAFKKHQEGRRGR